MFFKLPQIGYNLDTKALEYVASSFIELKLYFDAINVYTHLVERLSSYPLFIANLGYYLGVIKQYESSIFYLNQAIALNPEEPFSYNNRGIAKVQLGMLEEGFADIQHSLSLDNKNSYAYMNLGIYYLKKKDYEQAIVNFKIANEIDPNTLGLDEYKEIFK